MPTLYSDWSTSANLFKDAENGGRNCSIGYVLNGGKHRNKGDRGWKGECKQECLHQKWSRIQLVIYLLSLLDISLSELPSAIIYRNCHLPLSSPPFLFDVILTNPLFCFLYLLFSFLSLPLSIYQLLCLFLSLSIRLLEKFLCLCIKFLFQRKCFILPHKVFS